MLNNLTFEKVNEVIRLADQARSDPDGRADDPERDGPAGDDGLTRPATPPEPQPAPTWAEAFRLFLHDLADEALAELVALYRLGLKEMAADAPAFPQPSAVAMSHSEQIEFLTSRDNLVPCLQAALARL